MYKTHTCGELRQSHVGHTITLAGWVHRRRDHGGVIFIDLRDRFGLTQIVINPSGVDADAFKRGEGLRNEFVVQVTGVVHVRPAGMANPKMDTGEIEVMVSDLQVLNPAKTPPFEIDSDGLDTREDLRLQYRFLDLRRERMVHNMEVRHRFIKFIRDYLDGRGFLEIETPILFKSTPEGAREYLVPSRVHAGQFYALPQSPQQLKQLLMVGGLDRLDRSLYFFPGSLYNKRFRLLASNKVQRLLICSKWSSCISEYWRVRIHKIGSTLPSRI